MAQASRDLEVRPPVRTRGRPSSETAAQIDKEILEAARAVFFESGYASTSMAMIVNAAKVSKTTLYARYATKADLFQATVQASIKTIIDTNQVYDLEDIPDLAGSLIQFGDKVLDICTTPLWVNFERLVFAEGTKFPELTKAVGSRVEVVIENVARLIADRAERDGIACRSPRAIGRVYIMALRGFYTAVMLEGRNPDLAERSEYVRDLVAKLMPSRDTW